MAAHLKQEAILLLGIAGPASDPEITGQKFIEKMRTKARIEPVSTRKGSIGEFPVFVATYLDRSGRSPVYLHYAWAAMAGNTYQLIGMAPEKHRETLRAAALTLRPLTEVERGAVTGKRLRIATARPGERIDELTVLINGLEAEAPLQDGQLVKIARIEKARP